MPLFLSEEELQLLSNDAAAVADRADAFIHDLLNQLDVVRAESDAKTISEEQNCAILEQKYAALHSEFSRIQQENTQLSASTQKCLSELADVQSEKHQLHIKLIGRDGEVEKLSVEASELHKSLRQLMQLVEQKDAEISERNVTIQGYVEKIVHLSENNSSKDSKFYEVETELTRCQAACRRLTQEKELLEKQNVWLDEELSTKTSNLFELRKRQMEVEADLSAKISDFERQVKEHFIALNHSKDRVKELELRVKSLEEDLCSSRDIAAATEEHFTAELSTVNKLVELYKSSSDEWSKKAGELEGVIKALETHLAQVEDDYKEKLEKETSLRAELQKEVADLKTKLGKCEAELESTRKANESSLLPWSTWPIDSHEKDLVISDSGSDFSQTLVPRIATGVSGTAWAASLLRDGWSLTKMYEKYQEASDALLHEKWGRKHAEAVLERVLHEIEEKAEMILEERVEHERMVESYTSMAEKLQQALMEHDNYENNLRKLKAELRRLEREDSIAQKEINDLQKQVTILLKECQDVQLRCGGSQQRHVENTLISNVNSDVINAGATISDNNQFTFKDINELVELNAKLKSAVHRLSIDAEKKEAEFRDNFQVEFQRVADAAASKVEVVLKRSEEQASMIESLHSSVAMYKRLYEEEHKFRTSSYASAVAVPDDGKKELMLLFEGSQEISKKAYDQLCTRAKALEEDVARLSSEITSARTERDKMSLEASFAKERLASFMKEFDNQRVENTGVSARNMELTHLLIDYQKRVRESSASLQASEDNARKLSMEVSILKHEREIFVNSEKRMTDEIQSLRERVHRLQSSLDTVQSSEEVRESARATERRKQDDYLKRVERDLAEAKRELQEERDRFRVLALEKERAIESSMNQVEDIRKELANAWHVVATAESRAAVAEARSSDLDAKIKSIGTQAITEVDKQEQPSFSNNEISEDLWKTKEELHKIKDEAHANREYMLQYKEMARTNEIALKQIELAYEDYKSEAVKMKGVLENEVQSLKNQISELERKYMLKCEEAASATEAKEEVISSAMVETLILRDEIQEKTKRVTELESHVSFLKDDLDKEHRRWRNAQDNYERQIILQSETIQELTSTSKELSVMQTEISRIRSLLDAQKAENDLLKSSWETEKSEMQQSKTEAERKCNEMDEQNKILHNRLEALHVRLSEKDHNSVGHLSVNSPGDGDLQNVISYLRRSKEIAETEITLLKQEKLRLQTKVEGALKASESAQALLHSQLENARELLLKDDEFKSLQLQVREINLLRESNVQLREENKHNFEECQKFRQEAQNAKVEADKLENCLKQKQAEFNALQKEADLLKIEICNLNNRNAEILESCKDVNINEFEQMKDELAQVKVSLAKKLELITKLEQDLSGCHEELSEREKKLNDAQQAEKTLKRELEKQKKILFLWKNKYQSIVKLNDELSSKNEALTKEVEDLKTINQAILREKEEMKSRNQVLTKEKDDGSTKAQLSAKEKDEFMSKAQALAKEKDEFMSKAQALAKEKEEMSFKNQALLKQIEDLKLGRKVSVESEKAKKEQEKDTRIQMLEKTLERVRDDHRNEKLARKKSQTTMIDLANRVSRDKQKVEDELQKHKSAVSIVLEKAGALASQLPAGSFLDERTLTYFQSVSSFEAAAVSFLGDTEGPPHGSPAIATLDNSSTSTGQQVSTQLIKLPTRPSTKSTDEREKASTSGKAVVEVRKPGRRFVRPSLEKTEDPATDAEIAGTETCSAADGKASSSVENESLVPPMGARKRSASSEPEIVEASSARDEGTVVSAPPPSKKTKESEFSEASEAYVPPLSSENLDAARLQGVPTSEISEMDVLQSKEDPIEEYLEVGKEDEGGVPVNEESEEQQQDYLDAANPNETQYEGDAAIEELSDRVDAPIEEEAIDQAMKIEEIKEILFSSPEVEEGKDDGKEEGELMMEDETEQQPEDIVSEEGRLGSVAGDGSGSGDEAEDALDIASPDEQVARDPTVTDVEDVAEDSDKRSNSGIDRGALDSAPSPSLSVGTHEEPQNISAETGESQVVRTSTTISISEAAKRNAQNRQARMATPAEPPVRLRRPPLRRDGTDGKGHGGRG